MPLCQALLSRTPLRASGRQIVQRVICDVCLIIEILNGLMEVVYQIFFTAAKSDKIRNAVKRQPDVNQKKRHFVIEQDRHEMHFLT